MESYVHSLFMKENFLSIDLVQIVLLHALSCHGCLDSGIRVDYYILIIFLNIEQMEKFSYIFLISDITA